MTNYSRLLSINTNQQINIYQVLTFNPTSLKIIIDTIVKCLNHYKGKKFHGKLDIIYLYINENSNISITKKQFTSLIIFLVINNLLTYNVIKRYYNIQDDFNTKKEQFFNNLTNNNIVSMPLSQTSNRATQSLV